MKLLIFPGSASPSHPTYEDVYRLLRQRAPDFNYVAPDSSLRWPGHLDAKGRANGALTLDNAVQVGIRKVLEFEQAKEPYHILARSFGNYVAAKTILQAKPKLLRKLILWAPPSYWVLWRMLVRDVKKTEEMARKKWVVFDPDLFASMVPLETMLPRLKIECVAATGGKDKYCRHEYLTYLQTLVGTPKFTVREAVRNAPHEVHSGLGKAVVEPYLSSLFSANLPARASAI